MRNDMRGFTLIEMVAVLVLVGLLLAFSPLALDFLIAEKQLESEVSRLATMIDLTRTQAVLDQAPYAIHYDTEKARYAVQIPKEVEQESLDPDKEPVKILVLEDDVAQEDLDWHNLPSDFELEFYEGKKQLNGRFAVTFAPSGTVPPHAVVIESKKISSLEEEDRIRTLKVNFPGLVAYNMGRVIEDFKLSEAELGR